MCITIIVITADRVPEIMNVPPAEKSPYTNWKVRTTAPADRPGSAITQYVCIVLKYQGIEPRMCDHQLTTGRLPPGAATRTEPTATAMPR